MESSIFVDCDKEKRLISVTGAVKSGKSRWAEYLLSRSSNVTYIATLPYDRNDIDWTNRIIKHQQRRPQNWKLIDEFTNPSNLFSKLNQNNNIIIDSLGGLVIKHLSLEEDSWLEMQDDYLNNFKNYLFSIVIVVEAVGWGVSPSTRSGNLFRDRLGLFADKLDKLCLDNWLVLNGRAINISKFSHIVP